MAVITAILELGFKINGMTIALNSTLAEFKERVASRQARIGIVGMGYVGLPLALLFSEERFRVTGFDIAARKVSKLNAGGSYIVRILPADIQRAQKSGFSRHRRITPRSPPWTPSSSVFPPHSMSITSPI